MRVISIVAGAVLAFGLSAGAASADTNPLVTAEWVQENLTNENVRIFEVSVDTGV